VSVELPAFQSVVAAYRGTAEGQAPPSARISDHDPDLDLDFDLDRDRDRDLGAPARPAISGSFT